MITLLVIIEANLGNKSASNI